MKPRKQNRLTDFDYSSDAAYFITICTKDKQKLFWTDNHNDWYNDPNSVGANRVRPRNLSGYGVIVNNAIIDISKIYHGIYVDKYVIMPNHIHMIITIDKDDIDNGRTRFAPTISRIIKQTKGRISKQIGKSIWQRSFYDHIIRNSKEYLEIWQYIENNPLKWELDDYYIE